MSGLNWSLKLHIRLRTISILIPTHITHVYVQWMSYSFVWLYLFKCVSHTQFLLIKHKKIFESFNFFWKSLLFLQKYQKFQKQCCPILPTWSQVNPVACPQSRAYTEVFRDSLAGQSPSRKKDLENFSKFWVFKVLATRFGNLFLSGSSNHEVIPKFSQLPSRLICGWRFQLQRYSRR